MKYKKIVATNNNGGFVVLLDNGMYALVSSKKGNFKKGIMTRSHLESFLKWGGFELCSDKDASSDDKNAIDYNLSNCTLYFGL